MRQTIARIVCDGCGESIEQAERLSEPVPAVRRAKEEAEARGWWRKGETDWCGACKAGAKLAAGLAAAKGA